MFFLKKLYLIKSKGEILKFYKHKAIKYLIQLVIFLLISFNFLFCDDNLNFSSDTTMRNSIEVVKITPNENNLNIFIDSSIIIKFNAAIDGSTLVVNRSFILSCGSSYINGTLTEILPDEWMFVPSAPLDRNTKYTVTITTDVANDSGSAILRNDHFTTFTTKDYFKVSNYKFLDGTFDNCYKDYSKAFSDNTSGIDVDISSWIVLDFSYPVNTSTLTTDTRLSYDSYGAVDMPGTITLRRTHIGTNRVSNVEDPENIVIMEVVQWLNDNKQCILKPLNQHYCGTGDSKFGWYGIRPNSTYRINLSSSIEDIDGESLIQDGSQVITYSTVNLDYGLYFVGKKQPDGYVYAEKFIPGRNNNYFIPMNKTAIWTHGYTFNSTMQNYSRRNLMYSSREGTGGPWYGHDSAQYMIDDGWNFGIFYWGQFSDEPSDVKNIETKIWSSIKREGGANDGNYGMRYRIATSNISAKMIETNNPDFRGPIEPLSVEFYKQFLTAMKNNKAEKRLVGHSNGAHLIVPVTWLITKNIYSGVIDPDYTIDHLYMQEPFWSKDAKSYFSDPKNSIWGYTSSQWTGSVVCDFIDDIKEWDSSMAIQQDKYQNYMSGDLKTFGIDTYGGDNNYDLRKKTCVIYVYPAWVKDNGFNIVYRHSYGKFYYFWTYEKSIHDSIISMGGVTSRSSKSLINSYMNNGYDDQVFKQIDGSHRYTPYPGDDDFNRVPLDVYW